VMGLGVGFVNVQFSAWTQTRVPPALMGRVMSVLMFSAVGLAPLSLWVSGVLAQWSLGATFIVPGVILAIVAAVFIISKLKEGETTFGGTAGEKMQFNLVSTSPGIIFGILGTTLMMATILYNPSIDQTDSPLYLTPELSLPTNSAAAVNPPTQQGKIPLNEILSNLEKNTRSDTAHANR